MSVKGSRYQQSLSQFRTRVMRPVFHEFVFVFALMKHLCAAGIDIERKQEPMSK